MLTLRLTAFALAITAATAQAQTASFVYRLGKDTLGVEQYTRSGNHVTGDLVSRQGPTVLRVNYDQTYAGAKLAAVTYRILGADGKPLPGRPTEIRYTVKGDSVTRVVVWPDSTPTRTLAATSPVIALVAPAYSMLEPAFASMRGTNSASATFTTLGAGIGATLPTIALSAGAADTIRQASGNVFIVGKDGLLRAMDGTTTTAKIVATRSNVPIDVAALASRMTPTGTLSQRATARASFQTQQPGGVVMVDYGRPLVRDRTVWGGTLIPLDTIWRLGANEATHFATGRDLAFGDVVVPAGLYTLFLYNAKSGPMLAVNKQVGQWGTVYDLSKDVVRIPLTMAPTKEFMEEFTITVRQLAPNRGVLEFAWGSQMATANFTVR